MLIKNAAQCEFEINLNIAPIKWSVGEWRAMVKRQILDMYSLNITNKSSKYLEQQQSNNNHESNDYKYQKWFFNSTTHNTQDTKITTKAPLPHDEAFVIETTGTIISPNCDFSAAVNASAVRINWQRTSRKATNYSFYMMLICLTQIVLLMRQLLHSQPQSVAVRVSLICIGWQTVLDAMICIGHILLALSLQSMFSAFAMISFFKLLIFCVIEMKYMTIIIQARHNANDNILSNTNVHLQRKVTLLHIQFYCSLICALMLLWYVGWYYRTLYALFLYSFWLPQIVLNVITEAKMPLHHSFVKGMSLTRLVAPFYFFTNSNNFAREISQEFETDLIMCFILLLWVVLQAAVLIGQGTYGARFMIPSRFLPPKFDYSRPIPTSILPKKIAHPSQSSNSILSRDDSCSEKCTGPRNRIKFKREDVNSTVAVDELSSDSESPSLDCVICYSSIDHQNQRSYMLGPCNHIFHRKCLEQWMEIKMECPICRYTLPAI